MVGSTAPLAGVSIVDFSTLLPGPMATRCLADAGAEVIKVESPWGGDGMRALGPSLQGESVNFALLNRGKRRVTLDLKTPQGRDAATLLLRDADVLIEQFRPGVMARLGLGYETVRRINPRLIYCSINGWGYRGTKSERAGHDLNYVAETGILGLSVDRFGAPILPPILSADIGAGSYPAIINILLALRQRDRTNAGCWIDVAMGENLFPFVYWALGRGHLLGQWPTPNQSMVTGGSARYQIYRTKDGRYLAAAPLEDKFWANFTDAIGLPEALKDDRRDPAATQLAVANAIAGRTAAQWQSVFEGLDVCCSLVLTLEEAVADPHWKARGTFSESFEFGDRRIPALPSIVSPVLRRRYAAPATKHRSQ